MTQIQPTTKDFAYDIARPINDVLTTNAQHNISQTGQALAQKLTEITYTLDYLNECTNRLEHSIHTLEEGIEWYTTQPDNIKDGDLLDTFKNPQPAPTNPNNTIIHLDIDNKGEINNAYTQDGKCYPADSLHYHPIEPNAAQHYKGIHDQTTQTFINNYIIPAATYIQDIQPPQKTNQTRISTSNKNSITHKINPGLLNTESKFFSTEQGKTFLQNQAPRPEDETKYSSTQNLTPQQQKHILQLADQTVANATPYAWGGGTTQGKGKGTTQWDTSGDALFNRDDLKNGFDCSSLVQYLHYQTTGKNIGRTTFDQLDQGFPTVQDEEKQIGDLGYRGNTHVVMYIGDNKIIEAPTSGGTVSYRTLTEEDNFNWKRP